MVARFGYMVNKWTVTAVAALALMAVVLATALPAWAQNDNGLERDYAENGADPVATFTAVDPEGRTVYWEVLDPGTAADLNNDGDFDDPGEGDDPGPSPDKAYFSISMDGVLSFKSPPSFESPMGAGTPMNNTYNVVVVSYDDALGAALGGNDGTTDIRKKSYYKVTVTVTDVDEDGSVSLSGLQPQTGVAFIATLKDDDAPDTNTDTDGKQIGETWKWEQSSSMDGPWTLISGETAAMYSPVKDVAGMYLRATATYDDEHGEDKTAMAISAHSVRAKPAGNNSTPVFPDNDNIPDNDLVYSRKVKENSPPGTNAGKPVTAGDAGDTLTYSFDTTADNDHAMFSIDRATGQITVKGKLNAEAAAEGDRDTVADGFQLRVTVRATDPWEDDTDTSSDASVDVTITVENVNESPKMTVGPTRDSQEEIDIPTLAYAVTDVDADDTNDTIRWTLEGNDKDALKITKDDPVRTGAASSAMLQFKKSPNFEKPIDANMDNMYMVTVVATDKKKLTATRDVVITVTNADDPGKITFLSVQPRVRVPFVATLTDEDGVVGDIKWQWARDSSGEGDNPTTNCTTVTIATDGSDDIGKAKSDTYTPKGGSDGDIGKCLRATAMYTDSFGSTGTTAVLHPSEISANAVEDNRANQAPQFKLGDKVITSDTRSVDESAEAADPSDDAADATDVIADNVGLAVNATDANSADTLTYTLGGKDADKFRVRQDNQATAAANEGGQIEVGTGTDLDYEKTKSYMVTLTATDPSQASHTIDVTINVDDVNEGPVIAGEDDVTKEFRENSTGTIQTFSARDPERRTVYWSLDIPSALPTGVVVDDHADNARFDISSSGALKFKSPPDYERPKGADISDENTNTYKVVVFASDDAPGAGIAESRAVIQAADPIMRSGRRFTVRVTNVPETGSVTVNRYPLMGVAVTATLMDGDATAAEITAATDWKWYKGSDVIDAATSASYTPDATGNHKAEITYTAKNATRTASKPFDVAAAPTGDNAGASPVFTNDTEARTVDEGKVNANVGKPLPPVTDDTPGDSGKLTYTLDDTAKASFTITTGRQLKTRVKLDHETAPTHTVTVTATDPSGNTDTVTVTVTVTDVNEAPTFGTDTVSAGPTRVLDWRENTLIATVVATYTASDMDEDDLIWKLTGADASDFNIGNQGGDATPGQLTFKKSPDYEKPAASNNLYRVTVEVSDGKLKATRPMTVMVTDVEEGGKVKLSTVAPKEGVELTASLEDSDGDEKDVTWQWWKSLEAAPAVPDFLDGDGDPITTAAGWEKIDDAEADTYEPVNGDIGHWLTARASYADRRGTGKTAHKSSDAGVIINHDNRAPVFEDANDKEITETTRKVREDATENATTDDDDTSGDERMQVGNPVIATDPNTEDNLTYELTGADAALFTIESVNTADTVDFDDRGLISLKAGTKLDYEDKNTYMVTVTATDPNGEMASIDVTIKVTDVDEAPEIMLGGLAISSGPYNPYHPEDSSADVGTYQAVGSMKDSASWTLNGNDASHFMLEGSPGMSVTLKFMNAPDYEMPMDADMDNVYEVSVEATDSESNTAMRAVTVTVINLDEDGTVTLSSMTPVVGVELTATLTDPDSPDGVPADGITWQWSKSMTMDGEYMVIDGATMMSYTPMAADDGYYLMVKVMYTDGHGSGKEQMATTTGMVTTVPDKEGTVTLSSMTPVVGVALTATLTDPDGMVTGETWMWYKSMDSTFMDGTEMVIGDAMSSYTPMAADDGYYLMVKVMYTDGHGADKEQMATTGMVTTVQDQPGAVSLSSMTPMVGVELTATLSDPDGGMTGQTWMWSKSMTMDGTFMDIAGATSMNYTPMAADENYYLMVKVMYTDSHGSGKMATATSANAVTAEETLVARYDANNNGTIEKSEVITAINDYLFGEGDAAITKPEVIELINLYLFG